MFVDQYSRGEAAHSFEPSNFYERGLACSCVDGDLIEAHKCFNLAALTGHADAGMARAEVADQMTGRQIVEAQRRARAYRQSGH